MTFTRKPILCSKPPTIDKKQSTMPYVRGINSKDASPKKTAASPKKEETEVAKKDVEVAKKETRNPYAIQGFEDYGKHCFTGRVADKYLKEQGLSVDTLKDPTWVKDRKDAVAAAVLEW
jgi:hypothetical protein